MKFTAWLLYKSSSSVSLYFLNELSHPAGQGMRVGSSGWNTSRGHHERRVLVRTTWYPVRTVEAALSLAISRFQRARPEEAVSGALGVGLGGEVEGILRRADTRDAKQRGQDGACVENMLEEICLRLMEPGAGLY